MKWFRKNQLNTAEKENISNKKRSDILADAVQAADIVQDGLESRNYSDMSEKLEQLPSKNENTQFVFEGDGIGTKTAKIIICSVIILCFLVFLIVSAYVLICLTEFLIYGIGGATVSFVILAINTMLIVKAAKHIKFVARYEKYYEILRFHSFVLTDDIVAFSSKPQHKVIADLEKAIILKYIPQGHFGTDNIVFMTSDEAYDTYLRKQATYDRYFRQKAEERKRLQERSPEIAQTIAVGQTYIEKIHESSNVIKDKSISQKLNQMESVVNNIFHEVDINPKQSNKLGMLLDYYLPTTEKLLTAYMDLDEKEISGISIVKAKKDIEDSLDNINIAFERILEKFYQAQERDIASDIAALEVIMAQDGLK